jgi:uncharacterized membrane protein required for colicin V production
MTILDWVLVVVWAGITMGGFFKGAVKIVFSFGGLVLGLWLSVVVGPELTNVMAGFVSSYWLAVALAYTIPVVIVSGLCLLAGWGMEKSLEGLKLGCVNRLFGAALAGFAAAAVLAVLLVTAVRLSPEIAELQKRSVLLAKAQSAIGFAVEIGGDEGGEPSGAQDAAAPTGSGGDRPAATPSSGR